MLFVPVVIYAESPRPGAQTAIAQIDSPVEIIMIVQKPGIGGTTGYSINFASPEFEEPDFPRDGNTDVMFDFMQQHKIFLENFHQKASYRDSIEYGPLNETDLPKFFNFTYIPAVTGQMLYVVYNHHNGEENGKSASVGGFIVVERYSKAVNENGMCKNPAMVTIIKPDYSTVACVSSSTHSVLQERGWY